MSSRTRRMAFGCRAKSPLGTGCLRLMAAFYLAGCILGVPIYPLLALGASPEEVSPGSPVVAFFPELSGLPELTELHVRYLWRGLSLQSPLEIDYQLSLAGAGTAFQGVAVQSVGREGNPITRHPVVTKRNLTIPREVVRAFLRAV